MMATAKPKPQRQTIRYTLLDYVKAHPDVAFTLDDIEAEFGFVRTSVAGTLSKFIEDGVMPGLHKVGAGIYRYDSSGVVPEAEAEDEVAKQFKLVGNIKSNVIVISDSKGNLWRAERLR